MERIKSFDVARGLCVIWIVGLWHMNGLLSSNNKLFTKDGISEQIGIYITEGVLACFVFMSGYFLSKKEISNWNDVYSFYKSRIVRFGIPLFVTSTILFIGGWLLNWQQYLTTFCGISQLFPPPYPRTVWFFSMIILFYLFTPLLLIRKEQSLIISLLIFLALIIYDNLFLKVDYRLILYYWFYFIPFIFKKPLKKFFYKIGMLFLIVLSLYSYYPYEIVHFYVAVILVSLIIGISSILAKKFSKFFYHISYASMFAYLFHREIFIIFKRIWHNDGVPTIMLPVIIFCVFTCAYFMQFIYDKMIKKML